MLLDRDDLETHELGHASLSNFISPIVNAGADSTFLNVQCATSVSLLPIQGYSLRSHPQRGAAGCILRKHV